MNDPIPSTLPPRTLRVTQYRTTDGIQLEEVMPCDGGPLPADIARFSVFALIVISDPAQPRHPGIQVPYRFALAAQDIDAAAREARQRMPEEARKAYRQWQEAQTGPRILTPGQVPRGG